MPDHKDPKASAASKAPRVLLDRRETKELLGWPGSKGPLVLPDPRDLEGLLAKLEHKAPKVRRERPEPKVTRESRDRRA